MTDIDHFKKFNDNYGHTIGDHVLALVARTVKECIRSSDTAVRYGGEEFAVILPNIRIADAVRVAEQIRTAVASKRWSTGRRTSRSVPLPFGRRSPLCSRRTVGT